MIKSTINTLLVTFLTVTFLNYNAFAREGLWLPPLLKYQEVKMKNLGLQIPVSTLYSDKGGGLNNAVVLFGGGCTGSFISKEGLVLTNHHCGYGYGQRLSTPERNFLMDGFWAKSKEEEIPCPGLKVKITRDMIDVTNYITKDIPEDVTEAKRNEIIEKRMKNIAEASRYLSGLDAEVKSFYGGNNYYVMTYEEFTDVRMVVFPPNTIGKFGGDYDNWEWPRETGDFSIFRVYANKNNKPADFDKGNVPFKPDVFLPISQAGYGMGSMAMVYGFPYVTEEYLTSYELKRVRDIMYPIRVNVRGKILHVWDSAMNVDQDLFLKYASKQASISNGYKKWKGALFGLSLNRVMDKKLAEEAKFNGKAARDAESEEMKMLLPEMAALIKGNTNTLIASEYIREVVFGVELVRQAAVLEKLLELYRNKELNYQTETKNLQKRMDGFYKDYDLGLDKEIFKTLIPLYMNQNDLIVAHGMKNLFLMAGNNYDVWANTIFNESILANRGTIENMLGHYNAADTLTIKKDALYQLYATIMDFQKKTIYPRMADYQEKMAPLQRKFIAKKIEYAYPFDDDFYPDANQTLRLSYGVVKPLKSKDTYLWQTTLSDLIPRNNPTIKEMVVPAKLKELYVDKKYGKWGVNGQVPVNFITTSQTSGGNSGSPVLNAKGQLIGLNFDRPWQGTMSDFYFSEEECRNVAVDIRYVMFILEKYGEVDWLFKEMKFVR